MTTTNRAAEQSRRPATEQERARRSLPARTLAFLVAAIAGALLFLAIAAQVVGGHTNALDRTLSLRVHELDSPVADVVMRVFTQLGAYASIGAVAALVVLWCLRRGARIAAAVVAITSGGAMLLTTVVKLLFQRSRPDLFVEVAMPDTWSFPSGHSLVSLAAYGTMAFVAARLEPRLRVPLAIVTPAVVLMIGLSRIYLGVHWPTDVAAGFAAGVIVLVAAVSALGPATEASADG